MSEEEDKRKVILVNEDSNGTVRKFELRRGAIKQAKLIKNAIEEDDEDEIEFPINHKIPHETMELIVRFMEYHEKDPVARVKKPIEETPEPDFLCAWDKEFVKSFPLRNIFDLMWAEDFLDIPGLAEVTNAYLAYKSKFNTIAKVKEMFGITKEITEEEEREIRRDNSWIFQAADEDEEESDFIE